MTHLAALPIVAMLTAAAFAQTAPTLPPVEQGTPGDLVQMSTAKLEEIATLPSTVKGVAGPAFLFSDAPEYFPGDGIAMREDVEAGRTRFMIYHCPENTDRRSTITAVIENRGTQPMTLRFPRYSFPKPSYHYQAIGREAMFAFFSDHEGLAPRTVPPGGRVILDEKMDATTVVRDELVHAFGEFEVDQPARFIVLQRRPDQKTLDVVDGLKTLPAKNHGAGRGTFKDANFEVTTDGPIDAAAGVKQIVIADGKTDPWVAGRDAIDNDDVKNVGNYGVVYRIKLDLTSTNGKRFAILLAKPQEDAGYCPSTTAAMSLSVDGGKASVIALPKSGVLRRFPQAAMIGIVAPTKEKTTSVELSYTPPAASCLPTPILLVPID